MRRHGRRWSAEEDALIREHYPHMGALPLCKPLSRTAGSIRRRAWELRVWCGQGRYGRTPTLDEYRDLIRAECATPKMFALALSKTQRHKPCIIRFKVWAKLRAAGYSLPGIASAANKDHTTIISGLNRLKEIEARATVIPVHSSSSVFTRNVKIPLIRAVGMR